jgi:hypothetical protein
VEKGGKQVWVQRIQREGRKWVKDEYLKEIIPCSISVSVELFH